MFVIQQVAIMGQVRNFLDSHKVACAGPFLYAYVEEVCVWGQVLNDRHHQWVWFCWLLHVVQGTPNVKLFTKVLTLGRLARFLRESWVAMVCIVTI